MLTLLISSCQKEFVDSTATPGSGSGNGSGGGGTSNGDLLVKGVSITGADTNIINLKWDSNKRLVQYLSSGRTNGIAVDGRIDITRESNGNIKKVFSIPVGAAAYIDSVITLVYYQPSSTRIKYAKHTNYTSFGELSDSVLITYNAAGKISVKESYMENFLSGVFEKQSKSDYTYDAQGNLIQNITSRADANGNYSPAVTISNTYNNSHLTFANFGDDGFVVSGLGEETVSPNNIVKKSQTGTGTNATLTFTQLQYNTFNRPISGNIVVTPVPPGYTLAFTYFYQ